MRKSIAIVLFLSAMLVCMPSCITNKSTTLLQTDDKLPQYPKAEYEYYRIRPNDWLVMRVLTLNEESYEIYNKSTQNTSNTINGVQSGFRVYDDGTIDIPFIDGIPVAGLTVREAAKAVQDTLRSFVPDAIVKLALANDRFYVLGEATTGSFQLYKEKLNIFQAIALAGQIRPNSDRSRVTIIRGNPDGGRPIMKQFDLRTASIIGSEYYYVQPNDVLYFPSIKGDFFKVEDYTSSLGSVTTSLNFLVTVINLGMSIW